MHIPCRCNVFSTLLPKAKILTLIQPIKYHQLSSSNGARRNDVSEDLSSATLMLLRIVQGARYRGAAELGQRHDGSHARYISLPVAHRTSKDPTHFKPSSTRKAIKSNISSLNRKQGHQRIQLNGSIGSGSF